ncbi:MAG: PD-(D/E)XK nuclease family protein [Gemmatimonadetes bacterium]|nr:PD-(D/E)XK nuclease family protein [Gemmatimonadota bacterium]MYB55333.1 PD-(D/E)XK nuclease family protein [Gemmatimonadota bacterium]
MSNFQNEFSWSPSRHRMFDSCKRQYYFNYYGSWGGWDKDADAQTQLLYRLKKITTVPQLVGTVVHDAISNALNALKLGRDILPFAVETYAQNLFRQHLQESADHLWRYSASRYTNLFEHYYNEPFTETDQNKSANHISTSLNAFFASKAYATLQSAHPEDYLTIEDLTDFTLANACADSGQVSTKIWVVLDVAIRRDKSVYIFDWKTGRERQADRHQLAVYALYATSQWDVPLPDLQLQDIYLQTNTERTLHLSPDDLDQTRIFVTESVQKMRALLDDPEQNTASQDTFPMTTNTHLCTTCPFKAVCYPDDRPARQSTSQPDTEQDPVQLSLF